MSNYRIDITKNGITTLETAQKYCDRDIEVVVNVAGGEALPSQFTNILTQPSSIVKNGYRITSTGYTATTDGVAIIFPHY